MIIYKKPNYLVLEHNDGEKWQTLKVRDLSVKDIFEIVREVDELEDDKSIKITKRSGSINQEMNEVHHGIIEQWKQKGWV